MPGKNEAPSEEFIDVDLHTLPHARCFYDEEETNRIRELMTLLTDDREPTETFRVCPCCGSEVRGPRVIQRTKWLDELLNLTFKSAIERFCYLLLYGNEYDRTDKKAQAMMFDLASNLSATDKEIFDIIRKLCPEIQSNHIAFFLEKCPSHIARIGKRPTSPTQKRKLRAVNLK